MGFGCSLFSKVKTKRILTSIIILVSPLLVSEKAKFIMGHSPSISSNNVRNIGGDKPLQDFMRNLDTQGLVGYNTKELKVILMLLCNLGN